MNAEQEIRAKLGDFAADQDLMRDVYMTDSQRAAYERILARALEQREGFVMVPVEPTAEMTNAYLKGQRESVLASDKAWGVSDPPENFAAGYAAMLQAATHQQEKGNG